MPVVLVRVFTSFGITVQQDSSMRTHLTLSLVLRVPLAIGGEMIKENSLYWSNRKYQALRTLIANVIEIQGKGREGGKGLVPSCVTFKKLKEGELFQTSDLRRLVEKEEKLDRT